MGRAVSRQMLSAASVDAAGDFIELTGLNMFTATVTVTASAASLVGTLRFRGTNNVPQGAAEPILSTPIAISVLPANVTLTAGALAFASPTAATHIITLAFPQLPQFVQADWDFTSGGGTVAIAVQGAGWAVGD